MHYHANVRATGEDVRSLGSHVTRENATVGVFQVIGRRLQESGWVMRDAYLPVDGIGSVAIENLATGEEVSSSVWGCTCREGERDVRGLDGNDWRSTRAKARA